MHNVSRIYPNLLTDINHDGNVDLFGVLNGDVVWLENKDEGSAWEKHTISDGRRVLGYYVDYADINSDGINDVIISSTSNASLGWRQRRRDNPESWLPPTGIGSSVPFTPMDIHAADLDNDNDIDVIGSANNGDYEVSWFSFRGIEEEGILYSEIYTDRTAGEFFTSHYIFPRRGVEAAYQVRSSTSSDSMGEWSDTLHYDGQFRGTDTLRWQRREHEFFQYRVFLESIKIPFLQVNVNSGFSCELNLSQPDFSLYRVPAFIHDTQRQLVSNPGWLLLIPSVMPCTGEINALLASPVAQLIEISLFDSNGNLVAASSYHYPVGTHAICFDELSTGVYVAVIDRASYSVHSRFVVE